MKSVFNHFTFVNCILSCLLTASCGQIVKEKKVAFDSKGYISDGLIKVSLKGKFGFIDSLENIIIPIVYDDVEDFKNGSAIVVKKDKVGIINKKNEVVLPIIYDSHMDNNESIYGHYYIIKGDKWGIVDSTGRILLPFNYDNIESFSDGMARIAIYPKKEDIDKKDSWYMYRSGYINENCKIVIPLKYLHGGNFRNGSTYVVNEKGLTGFIDKSGKEVIPFIYDAAKNFNEGVAAVMSPKNHKYGFIDINNDLVLNYKYDEAFCFSNGICWVQKMVDMKNRDTYEKKLGYRWLQGGINLKGETVIPFKYVRSEEFSEGFGACSKIVSSKVKNVPLGVPYTEDEYGNYYYEQWGYVDLNGKEVTEFKYDHAWPYENGKAHVQTKRWVMDIDYTGKVVDSTKIN